MKPANVLVNPCQDTGGDMHFKDVFLADLGDAVSTDSVEATSDYLTYPSIRLALPSSAAQISEATLMMPFTIYGPRYLVAWGNSMFAMDLCESLLADLLYIQSQLQRLLAGLYP